MSLLEHLQTGITTVARCWKLTRADGVVMGFTDHDRNLRFDGVTFRADSGLSARAVEASAGLAVDNSEAMGALVDAGLTEADIMAGRYDGAEVELWEINWEAPAQRRIAFRGTLGEITRAGGAFRAELRGLTEALGQARGRVFQPHCGAVLGDAACGFDLSAPGFRAEVAAEAVLAPHSFTFAALEGFSDRWFAFGRLEVLDGPAAGLSGVIRSDRMGADGLRRVELWQGLAQLPRPGDMLRLEAGCDKRAETCRFKFANFVNFRGFPHIPREDWVLRYPRAGGLNDGGPLRGEGA